MTLLIQESEFKSVVFSFGCHKCIEDDDDHVAWPAGPGRVHGGDHGVGSVQSKNDIYLFLQAT